MEADRQGIRAIAISLVVLSITAVLQLVVVGISGSVALLADTVHNASDALTALPLWIAFTLARRGRRRGYTYGYGRAEDLAGLFIVAMIALSAVVAGVESVRRLIDPQPVTNIGWVIAAGVIGFIGNEVVALYRIRVGRRIGSAALVADGLHARTDGFTSLAVVVGAIGVGLGFGLADPLVGLAITVAILFVLKNAATEVWRRLMDGVDPNLVERATAVLAEQPDVQAVQQVRLRWMGHRLLADADVLVSPDISVGEGHDIAHAAERQLIHDIPKLVDVTVHVSPATAGDPTAEDLPASRAVDSGRDDSL